MRCDRTNENERYALLNRSVYLFDPLGPNDAKSLNISFVLVIWIGILFSVTKTTSTAGYHDFKDSQRMYKGALSRYLASLNLLNTSLIKISICFSRNVKDTWIMTDRTRADDEQEARGNRRPYVTNRAYPQPSVMRKKILYFDWIERKTRKVKWRKSENKCSPFHSPSSPRMVQG